MANQTERKKCALTDRKEIARIKRWAIQFSAMEWNELCSNKEFLGAVLEDNALAEKLAAEMVGREILKME